MRMIAEVPKWRSNYSTIDDIEVRFQAVFCFSLSCVCLCVCVVDVEKKNVISRNR